MDFGEMLIGDRVPLVANHGATKPCRWCGHNEGILQPAKGPHGEGVRCCNCGRHLGWLPKARNGGGDVDVIDLG